MVEGACFYKRIINSNRVGNKPSIPHAVRAMMPAPYWVLGNVLGLEGKVSLLPSA